MSIETKDVIAAFKRRPLLFVCGGLVFVLGVTAYFRQGVTDELHGSLVEREKELLRLTNNTKNSAQLDAQLGALRGANAKLAAGALRAGELARNQQLFYRLEAETGVKLLDLRQIPLPPPAKGAAPTTYSAIPFSLTIKGDYSQLIDFLRRLDSGETLARVTTGSIARPAEGAQTLSLGVEMLGFRS